jgi:hypothetical protein
MQKLFRWLQAVSKQIKCFIKENYLISFLVIFASFLILGLADYYYKFFYFLDRSPQTKSAEFIIDSFNAIEITFLTFILIIVAWRQLSSLNKTGTADFLLRIDERFASKQIIEARIYIQELYIKFRPNCTHSERGAVCDTCHVGHMQAIRDGIKSIRHNITFSKTFVQLRNLLELFETIGYFSKKGYIDYNEINELVGGTIEFHYEVFRDWIHYLQDTKHPTNFNEFEGLVYKINPRLVPEDRKERYK